MCIVIMQNLMYYCKEINAHPQDEVLAVNSMVMFSCTSSVSSNVIFSWTHNGTSISGSSTTGDTSILTITSVRNSDAGSYVCTASSGSLSAMSNTATLTVYGMFECVCMCVCVCVCVCVCMVIEGNYVTYATIYYIGPPVIINHPNNKTYIPVERSVTLMCRASGLGMLSYSWQRRSGSSSWTTVSNDNTTSYTTDTTLATGHYMYRCRVSNNAGSAVSNNAIVNVYGEYCPNM